MDCFFAAVEVLDNPTLKGKPVIVGGTTKRGVVCAASYEARKYGVKSAMALFQAHQLCPKGIYLPVRMERYKEISGEIHQIFQRYTDLIQPISMDEAFLDVTENKLSEPYAMEIAKQIKKDIKTELGLIASAGIAPNKFLAKIASDMDKPDGFYVIKPNQINSFMKTLPVGRIWGVGRVMREKLNNLGIYKASDFEKFPEGFFEEKFGKMGYELLRLSKGVDESSVKPYRQAKSIGHETTFSENITEKNIVIEMIKKLSIKVENRIQKKKQCAKGVQLKIKFDDFKLITRSQLNDNYFDRADPIFNIAQNLFNKLELNEFAIRLIGVSVYQLKDSDAQQGLFDYLS